MSSLEINDAIHKTVALSESEQNVVDHPYVQRLRYIRQLGFVPFVYPSATHDRFSHSLGTLHVATLLARQVLYDETLSVLTGILSEAEKKFFMRVLRLAAILHDIGHAPFSHTAESVMPQVASLALPRAWLAYPGENRIATHEDYSVLMINGMTEGPHAVFDEEEAEIVSSLIHHKKIKMPASWTGHFSKKVHAESLHMLAATLISSNIDADRMDYLLRDAHFTGVAYGQFDLRWLVANLGVVENGGAYMLSISEAGVHALEHYLFARYHMYVQVYMHKTVKCFEYYFQKALDERETAYVIPAERDAYVALRDSTLTETLFRAAERDPHSWSARLMERKPAKRIARTWGDTKEAQQLFKKISDELRPHSLTPFLHITTRKFLDLPDIREQAKHGGQGSFLFGFSAMPMAVVRKQLGVVSIAPLADYSFILKHYHRDMAIGDLYILPEEYEKNKKKVHDAIKKYRTYSSAEVAVRDEV
jgi:uncharacterized protein